MVKTLLNPVISKDFLKCIFRLQNYVPMLIVLRIGLSVGTHFSAEL